MSISTISMCSILAYAYGYVMSYRHESTVCMWRRMWQSTGNVYVYIIGGDDKEACLLDHVPYI
ncbi:hypothetical protein EON63_17205 [archaeon]|nr:MAG: hypothetical protein EON63_17205 [archaeon]